MRVRESERERVRERVRESERERVRESEREIHQHDGYITVTYLLQATCQILNL